MPYTVVGMWGSSPKMVRSRRQRRRSGVRPGDRRLVGPASAVLVTALLFAGAIGPGGTTPAVAGVAGAAAPALVDRQVIVEWKPGVTEAQKSATLLSVRAAGRSRINADPAAPVDVVDVGTTASRAAAVAALAASGNVVSAEPNRRLHTTKRPRSVVRRPGKTPLSSLFNDPLLVDGTQWSMLGSETQPGNTYGVDAVSAWRKGITGKSDIYVGVVDEGIDISHPDLAANVFTNRWDPPNGIDDDGNGYIDDTHGWDFVDNDNSVYDGQEHFDFVDAHGTVVAGEIGAVGGNHLGVAGVNWNVKVIPAKFLGPTDGSTADAVRALDYLTDLKIRHGLNIVATNNSYEGDDTDSHALQAAIQRGANADILFVTIAGNGDFVNGLGYDIDRTPNYPASLRCRLRSGADCMIVTTAIDDTGQMPDFANWGKRTVDLGAPGVLVWSTFPFADYQAYDGTSQAAPLVAGAIALYQSRYPGASATRIRHALLQSTMPTASLANKTRTGGRLDIDAMLANDHDVWRGDWWRDGRE